MATPKASLEEMLATIPQQNRSALDQKVSDSNLVKIARELTNWKSVGAYLGISKADEEAIEEDNRGTDARRRAVLQKWREKHGPAATYRNLAVCFYKADNLQMVERVCQALGASSASAVKQHVQQEDSSVHKAVTNSNNQEMKSAVSHKFSTGNRKNPESESALSCQPSFQQLSYGDQEELKERLDDDVRKMKRLFGCLVTKTRDSVEAQIPVGTFATSILALRDYEPAPEERDQSLLDEHREEINKAKTISEIFNILCPYWDYLNYEILEYIIELYGTSDDKERLRSYSEELHKFCMCRVFELPIPKSGSGSGNALSPSQEKFVVKLNVREGTTCKKIRRIKGRIAKILDVNLGALTIDHVDMGCVQLTFLIPRFVAQEIRPLSNEQKSQNALVVRLEYAQDYVFENTSETFTENQSTVSMQLINELQDNAAPTHELSEAAIPAHQNPNWEDIRTKFATFQKNVCNKLFSLGVDIEKIQFFVTKQFSPGDFIPPSPATLMEIFEAVTYHGLWSYFHYSPLVLIATSFGAGDSEIKGWVQTYKEHLKAYCLGAKLEDYVKADLEIAKLPQAKRAKCDSNYCLPLEWKTKFTDNSLQYLAEVWEMFSSHYLMPESPPTALFDRVCKLMGCYSITWLIPSKLIPIFTRRIKEIGTDFFSEHHILRVTVGNQCVYEEVADNNVSEQSTPTKAQLRSEGEAEPRSSPEDVEKLGGYDCKFVLKPPIAFQTKCPICHLILRDPYQAKCCGNSFCHSCIEGIHTNHKPCPMCRNNFDIFEDKRLQRSLSQLHVFCKHRKDGCMWKGELRELQPHLNIVIHSAAGKHRRRSNLEQQHSLINTEFPRVLLELKPAANLKSKLFKLETGWVLRFTLSPSFYAMDVHLFTDYPAPNTLHCRGKMRELKWTCTTRRAEWDPDRYVDIHLDCAGSFQFKYTTATSVEEDKCSGFFVVAPTLKYHPNSLCCQTYITKLLGQLSEWKEKLQVAKQTGYNMLHFTPIQQLGSSQSAYSISDQKKIDSSYLPANYTHTNVTKRYTTRKGTEQNLYIDSSFLEVQKLMNEVRNEWGLLSIVDVVWNHTSFDTPWLIEHPEAGYNLVNSPHLRPAYDLDVALAQFSRRLAEGKWKAVGLQPEVQSEEDLHQIRSVLLEKVLPHVRLWEYFCVDVEAVVKEFCEAVYYLNGGSHSGSKGERLQVKQDPEYRRLGSRVDMDLALELFNVDWPGVECFEKHVECCCIALREELHQLNQEKRCKVQDQLELAVENLIGGIRYQFLALQGPHRQRVTVDEPLVPRYFVSVGSHNDLHCQERDGEYVLALDGWIMSADPPVNFAAEGSNVYFQRELIVWEDVVKLHYGQGPGDSPWLWEHMRHYTQTNAWIFDGFCINNCHNIPIHVAEWMLDTAREVNPNLYVVAELFIDSEKSRNNFVNHLGINSVIKEALSAFAPHNLATMVYNYSGEPVASFLPPPSNIVLKPSVVHAMFMDATHNHYPGHIQSRSVYDALPNTALVAITSCPSGSYRGYDELVPHMIDVVKETRPYTHWASSPSNKTEVGMRTGIMAAKAELNALHRYLAEQGFTQIHVNQQTEEVVTVTRHSPSTHGSVILIAHTAFKAPDVWAIPTDGKLNTHYGRVPPLTIPGLVKEVILEARLVPPFQKHSSVINGLQSIVLEMQTHISLSQSRMCHLAPSGSWCSQVVVFNDFCPGSIIAFKVSLIPGASSRLRFVRSFLKLEESIAKGKVLRSRMKRACSKLSLLDLNYALYRCDSEESDEMGSEAYHVPGAGALVYCGLQGIMAMLRTVRENNNLSHPICDNIREGDWMTSCTANRLKLRAGTEELGDVLSTVFGQLSYLPRYLIPCYFEAVLSLVHGLLTSAAVKQMQRFIQEGSTFVKGLALGSVQVLGECSSGRLPPPIVQEQPKASLAAGLPHTATGAMRCWGRDTFISLRGLLLITGRYKEARDILLSFAVCLRHGLIPNLLNKGSNPRYNSRDATWWWLQGVQDYCQFTPNGQEILQANVRRLYPHDDATADSEDCKVSPLSEIVQEVLQRHISGIFFRERGAGPGLDCDMTPPGFDVQAGVDLETGFVYGGNVHNCGTWMSKVGQSLWAGNKGVPATPRDGSAVELVGLCHSAVSWLARLHEEGTYPYAGVEITSEEEASKFLTFSEWATKIHVHFEARFWIPKDKSVASRQEGQDAGYIHRTGIYKDCVGASQRYADFQLRPNFPIAMVVSPELFTAENAWDALNQAETLLLGPLGMRTLDPDDYIYNGYYNTTMDSNDYNTARGFNYHQGPEWLWVMGYFLRAKLHFAQKIGTEVDDTISRVHQILSAHAQALQGSPWAGLPELTNRNGAECDDSCQVQASSMACLLDVLYDLHKLQTNL